MKSIPLAMTWELFRRGRWSLPAGFLAANLLPVLLLGVLQRLDGLDPDEPSLILIQIVMVQINAVIFSAAAL